MAKSYIFQSEQIFFKHEISENIKPDTYAPHIHNGFELIYFLDGDATHIIEGRRLKLQKGDLVLIRPLQHHFIQIDGASRYERYDILFDSVRHGIEGIEALPENAEVVNLCDNPLAQDVFRRCDFYKENCSEEDFNRLLPHLLSELFYSLRLSAKQNLHHCDALSPTVSRALEYINQNLCTLTDIKEISDNLYVSESYLFRAFKRELHQTPKKYILEKRLLVADKLLDSGMKPTAVAQSCGFSDYTTFYRNFVEFFGYSPKAKNPAI